MPFTTEEIEGAVCPHCGGKLLRSDRFITCENEGQEEGQCRFFMSAVDANDKQIPDEDILKLCQGEIVGPYTFHSKAKDKDYTTYLKCDKDTGKVEYVFDPSEKEVSLSCPCCGTKLHMHNGKYGKYLACPNHDFRLSMSVCGHEFTVDEIADMIGGATLHVDNFVSKAGREFGADIAYDPAEKKLKLMF